MSTVLNSLEKIPIIDCAKINGHIDSVDDEELKNLAIEFGAAMSGIGFAYLINHGIDLNSVDNLYKKSVEFFTLPSEDKFKYRKPSPKDCFHGYSGPGDELLNENKKNSTELREFFDVWGKEAADEEMYPTEIQGFKETFDNLRSDCNNLGKKLLRCLGKFLKLEDEDFFIKYHKNLGDGSIRTQTQFRTLYYYPLDPNAEFELNAIRCGEHSDWGTITLLFQDMTGGLEVKTIDGRWVEATPIKDSIIINSGQLLELWTAGHLPATPHRVRITNDERLCKNARQSCIYFINPDGDTAVSPVLPIAPGKEEFAFRRTVIAYDHYQRLIADAASY